MGLIAAFTVYGTYIAQLRISGIDTFVLQIAPPATPPYATQWPRITMATIIAVGTEAVASGMCFEYEYEYEFSPTSG